jgi:drug/metabolite transporter (DMT)-like permease
VCAVNPAYLLAALGSLLYGSADFCGGLASRRGHALAVTYLAGFSALAVLFAGLPFSPGVTRASDLGWAVAGGAFGAIGAMLAYRALAIGPVSVASPIFSITGVTLPVLVGMALGEKPGWIAIAGLALTPPAIVLLAQGAHASRARSEEHTRHIRGAVARSLIAGAVLGFFLVFLGRIQGGASLWPLITARVAGIVCLGAVLLARREALFPARLDRPMSLVTGVLDSLANLAYVAAVPRGSLSLVAALVSLAPATSVLLARMLLNERWSPMQAAGLVLALGAGVCISLG